MGHIRNVHGGCLEASDPDAAGGSVQMWACASERQGQQWAYNNATGTIQNVHGACLDAPERHREGSDVHIWECLPEQRNQQWAYDEATRHIRSRDGLCLDAFQRDVDGGGLHMWHCLNGEPNQEWELGGVSLGSVSTGQPACHTAKAGEPCHAAVTWAMEIGIVSHPEWYPELNASSSFIDFQGWLNATGVNDNVCPVPCRPSSVPAPTPHVWSNATASCSRLPNVVLPCAHDGCKAVVKRMWGSTCRDYCAISGLTCVGAWKNVWQQCTVEQELHCDAASAGDFLMCECGGPLPTTTVFTNATTETATTTAEFSTTPPPGASTSLAPGTTPPPNSTPSPTDPGKTTVSLTTTRESSTTVTLAASKSCSSVLGIMSGHQWSDSWYTCGERINWLKNSGTASNEEDAMIKVSLEFTECEPCWPWKKYKAPDDARLSGKRGIAIQNYLLGPVALANIAKMVSWGYIWDYSPDRTWPKGGPSMSEWNAAGIRFIPMTWGDQGLASARTNGLPGGMTALLGFNEPNFLDQASLTPTRAAELWPLVEELAARHGINYLVSPAVNFNGNHDPMDWLGHFFSVCTGCKVDAIGFHSYTCRGQYLKDHIDMYRTFGKPLWLTEFACSEAGRLSMEGQMEYMKEVIPLLEHDPDIEMYAWFSYFQDEWKYPNGDLNGDAGLVYANGTLSPLGKLYGSFASTRPMDAAPLWVPPTPAPTPPPTTTTPPPISPIARPDVCRTAISGETCYNEVLWAMRNGIGINPSWYPGLTADSSFYDFQRFLHVKGHKEGICPAPCPTCHTAREGEACYGYVANAMQRGIHETPWRFQGLQPTSSMEDFQRLLRGTRQDGGTCARPCGSDGGAKLCHETPGGCRSIGVNIFGKDGFESLDAMRASVHALFANGIRHFRLVNVGAWQEAMMDIIDRAAASFGVSDKVSLHITSFFFESPASCPTLPSWQDYSLTTSAMKLKKLKNIGRFLVQLDTCSPCPGSPLYCINPTEQAFGQDLLFASTATAHSASEFVMSDRGDGYGPAHIVAAHRAFPRNVEFVLPYMSNAQSPMFLVEHVVNTYVAPLRATGRKFHLEGTIYPFWTSSEQAFAPFPAAQVHGFVAGALSLGVDGFIVAETGWPEACPGADPTTTRPASLRMKCDYMGSVIDEAERLAEASSANGDGELLTYLWKLGPADDGSRCGEEGFGLFRGDGSFACEGVLPGWRSAV